MKDNKNWKERFEKEVEEDKSMGGTLYLHKWIPNFIEQIISENWEEFEKERTIHKMELDAISLFSVKDFIKWKEHKLQTLNK